MKSLSIREFLASPKNFLFCLLYVLRRRGLVHGTVMPPRWTVGSLFRFEGYLLLNRLESSFLSTAKIEVLGIGNIVTADQGALTAITPFISNYVNRIVGTCN